jgi:hypothetical protein
MFWNRDIVVKKDIFKYNKLDNFNIILPDEYPKINDTLQVFNVNNNEIYLKWNTNDVADLKNNYKILDNNYQMINSKLNTFVIKEDIINFVSKSELTYYVNKEEMINIANILRNDFISKDDLNILRKDFVSKEDLREFVSKEDLREFVSKEEYLDLKENYDKLSNKVNELISIIVDDN